MLENFFYPFGAHGAPYSITVFKSLIFCH